MKFTNLQDALNFPKRSRVTTLDLSHQSLTELSPEVGVFENLRVLNLEKNSLKEIPESIGNLKNLTTLNISFNKIAQLPHQLGQLFNLLRLFARRNDLKELPDVFAGLQELNFIDVANNQLTDLPPSIGELTSLKELIAKGNAISKVPFFLFQLPSLKSVSGLIGDKPMPLQQLKAKFDSAFSRSKLPLAHKHDYFYIYTGHNEMVNHLPIKRFFEALSINNPVVRINAINYLKIRTQNKPLEKGSNIAVLGKTSMSRQEIKTKLQSLGLQYQNKVDAKTTHLLIGNSPKNYPTTINEQVSFLAETDLLDYINAKDTPYLLVETDDTVQNVATLIASGEEPNMGIAIQILEGGGLPEELLTDVFFVFKTCTDRKTKATAKKLLSLYGGQQIESAMNFKERLLVKVSKYGDKSEKKVYKTLKKYAAITSAIHWTKLAWLLYQKQERGLRYFFEKEPIGTPLRMQVLNSLKQGTALNYFKAYSTYKPSMSFEFAYTTYTKQPFPNDILTLTDLTNLNISYCYLAQIPGEIEQLQSLQSLNVSGNFLNTLPANFVKLRQLRYLNISNNEFTEFPTILLEMPWIEEIVFRSNRKGWDSCEIKIPESMQEKTQSR